MALKGQKIFSLFLSLMFLIGSLNITAMAAQSSVGYLISGEAEDRTFNLHVSLQNVRALSGRLAISFDTDKLALADASSYGNAVKAASGVVLTQAGIDESLLLSNRYGYAMFVWYSSSNAGIDATSSDREIVTIPFVLKSGVTTDDFSRNTISLYYVNNTMVDGWNHSASIITSNLEAYRNNSIYDEYVCGINYDYPNCDYVPIITHSAAVNVTDYSGNPINAEVTLDNLESSTGSSGQTSFQMEDGVYAYRVSASGYETKSGYLIINGNDETLNVQLMNNAQLAASIADNLNIIYKEGDSAESVTADLSLVTSSDYGAISWESSDSSVVDEHGIVNRGEDDARVTLTATVYVGNAAERRSFDITVRGRVTAEEKNASVVARDKAALDIEYAPGDSQNSVTADLTLAQSGAAGSGIVWISSNDSVISQFGHVERPVSDTQIKLTAYLVRGTAQDSKEFTVTVKGTGQTTSATDAETVKRVLNALTIGYAEGDSASSVTQALALPQSGADDTIIVWTSSNPSAVTSYGGVVRQTYGTNVTLTATAYKGSASDSKTFTVTVKAAETTPVNPSNGQEEEIRRSTGGGGTVTVREPSQTAAPSQTQPPASTPAPTVTNDRFTDIASVPWAREAILTLADRGVISGTSDTTYSPQNNIRRADFITLLMRLLNLDGEITDTFEDVPRDKYYYESVSLAKSLGIISGIDDSHFNPEGSITRQDMMVMTYRALKSLDMADMRAADLSTFRDADRVSDYAYESVSHLVGGGYINGDDTGNLNPVSNTTRAETAVFLYQLGI